ncbi:CLIP domain-containing serine protease B4-like [Topomyia yanbarensis]|uniref:CLIP domain-containing serine protease B4-like n=1 Tax=Topomyia yanbarensis TaxID=2498891 RepID=UPI00273CAD74|nr:CLIP domain-containing serine protease B4-like [Topomyia yanbarensis]
MTILLSLWAVSVAIVASQAVDLYDPCEDAAGAPGICVPVKSCEPVSAMLKRGNLSGDERNYLKKSNCGMMNSGRAVCCPFPKMLKARFDAPATLPAVGICGIDSGSRIVGGEVAQLDEYPWLARIQYYKSNKRFGFHCGGVLVNERYVLTAAHCIQNVPASWKVYKIRLGEYDTESDLECNFHDKDDCADSVQDVLVSSYYIHEDYFQENGADYNDIALIRLSVPVNYTDYIRPICLPTTDELKKLPTEGKKMTVAGWGQTETGSSSRYKKFLQIEAWENDRCAEAFSSANVDIVDSQLCAGGVKGEDSCRGDSGGPLMKLETVGRQSAWYLKGIVSFGSNKCGTENVPGVYTRLSSYVDWILENIEE